MPGSLGVLATLLALLCTGCTEKPSTPPQDASPSSSRTPVATNRDSVTAKASDSLRISLDVPPEVRAGHPVRIVIRLENTGTRPLDLSFRGRTIAFDIFITRPDGQVVWQRLKDQMIPAILQLKVLQPKEVLKLEDEWDQRDNGARLVPPGSYVAQGSILTDGPALETRTAPLRIVPPR